MVVDSSLESGKKNAFFCVVVVVVVAGLQASSSEEDALLLLHEGSHSASSSGSALGVPLLSNAPNQLEHTLLDVVTSLGRGLEEIASHCGGEFLSGFGAHLSRREVALVADEDRRRRVRRFNVLHVEDLGAEVLDLIEGGVVVDAVEDDEALARTDPLSLERGELFLAGGVEDVEDGYLFVDDELLAVRRLDRWIVVFDKVVRNQLNRERRLSHTSSTKDGDLDVRDSVVRLGLAHLFLFSLAL